MKGALETQPTSKRQNTGKSADIFGSDETVHVWRVSFDLSNPESMAARDVLSADERQRADRYVSEEARRRFVTARSTLRHILARYLSTDPEEIVFAYNQYGRPVVDSPAEKRGVVFNLSHSAERALYAISGGAPVGVDVERMRPLDFTGISKRFFAPSEAAILAALPEPDKSDAFFECWTRKEALVKAQGTGLHLDLNQVVVTLGPDTPPHVVRIRGSEDAAGSWSLYDLDAGEGFKAALAVKSRNAKVIQRDYPDDTAF